MNLHLVFLMCVQLMCSTVNDTKESSVPPSSLIGKWEMQNFTTIATKQNGTVKSSVNEFKKNTGISTVWEFFKDGKLVITQEGESQETKWSIEGNPSFQSDITNGKLKITGGMSKQLAASFGQDELIYMINTRMNPSTEKPTMNLEVDITKIGRYKQCIMNYLYFKI